MIRTPTIVTLAILSSVLTPVVVKATGTAETAAVGQQAKMEVAVAATMPNDEQPACARRVKVVYAGYGEAHAAACVAGADLRR